MRTIKTTLSWELVLDADVDAWKIADGSNTGCNEVQRFGTLIMSVAQWLRRSYQRLASDQGARTEVLLQSVFGRETHRLLTLLPPESNDSLAETENTIQSIINRWRQDDSSAHLNLLVARTKQAGVLTVNGLLIAQWLRRYGLIAPECAFKVTLGPADLLAEPPLSIAIPGQFGAKVSLQFVGAPHRAITVFAELIPPRAGV